MLGLKVCTTATSLSYIKQNPTSIDIADFHSVTLLIPFTMSKWQPFSGIKWENRDMHAEKTVIRNTI